MSGHVLTDGTGCMSTDFTDTIGAPMGHRGRRIAPLQVRIGLANGILVRYESRGHGGSASSDQTLPLLVRQAATDMWHHLASRQRILSAISGDGTIPLSHAQHGHLKVVATFVAHCTYGQCHPCTVPIRHHHNGHRIHAF